MAKATQSYMRLIDALPPVLVATEYQLRQIAKILCREMHDVFVRRGASIPPWRGMESLLSKWRLPRMLLCERSSNALREARSGTVKASWQPTAIAASKPMGAPGTAAVSTSCHASGSALCAASAALPPAVAARNVRQSSCGMPA
jgi:PDDEXK-like family of unknown function